MCCPPYRRGCPTHGSLAGKLPLSWRAPAPGAQGLPGRAPSCRNQTRPRSVLARKTSPEVSNQEPCRRRSEAVAKRWGTSPHRAGGATRTGVCSRRRYRASEHQLLTPCAGGTHSCCWCFGEFPPPSPHTRDVFCKFS